MNTTAPDSAPRVPAPLPARSLAPDIARGLMLALNAAADAREIPFPVGDPLFLAGKVSPTDAGARLDGQSFVIWRA